MKLPKKFYVARSYRGNDEVLGYMVVADNEETKGFQKKKAAADRWTNNSMEAIYVDNEPKTGFQMVTNVSRYSTSNVVWRIRHPAGFEFEITSTNMCDLLATNTIVNGEFQDELFFTDNRSLVNTKTTLYANMIEAAEAKEALKETAKSILPGMGFRIDDRNDCSGKQYRYMGKVHSINVPHQASLVYPNKSTLYHVIHDITNNMYYLRSKMELEIVRLDYLDIEVDKVDKVQVAKDVNEFFRNRFDSNIHGYNYLYDYRVSICASAKPFTLDKLEVQYRDVSTKDMYVEDRFLYLADNKGTKERVFGFSYQYDYRTLANQKHEPRSLKMFTYPGELHDDGNFSIDVDLSSHLRLTGSYPTTPFSTNGYSSDGKKPFSRLDIPDTIQEGFYKVKGE